MLDWIHHKFLKYFQVLIFKLNCILVWHELYFLHDCKVECFKGPIDRQVLIYNIQTLFTCVDINDLADITSYLHSLDRTAVFNLGLVLGLDYNRLKAMMDTPIFLQEMLAGWLQRVDQVLKKGVPTWRRLAEALKDPRVGQIGLACEIESNK